MSGRVLRQAFPDAGTATRRDVFGTVAVRRVPAEAAPEKESTEYAAGFAPWGYLSGGESSGPMRAATGGGDRPGPDGEELA